MMCAKLLAQHNTFTWLRHGNCSALLLLLQQHSQQGM